MGKDDSVGRWFAWLAAGALLIVAVFYLAAPFSVRVEPLARPAGLPSLPLQESLRADCSGPWRQIFSPPSMHTTVETGSRLFTTIEHNRQPLCESTGRSRALFSGWLLLAVVALLVLVIPRRRRDRRSTEPQADATVVDLV